MSNDNNRIEEDIKYFKEMYPLADASKSEFLRFMQLATDGDPYRLEDLMKVTGYLISKGHVDKIVYLTNTAGFIGHNGKSLYCYAIQRFLNYQRPLCILVDGRHSMSRGAFPFGASTRKTQLIIVDDICSMIDMDDLLQKLPLPMMIQRKATGPLRLSPRFLVNGERSILTEDNLESIVAIEFGDYFNKTRLKDQFGHLFFEDWSLNEWESFTLLMLECKQLWKKDPVLPNNLFYL
jgi:hypothetical protein